MKNINALLQEKSRTSIFIAHRLRTVVESGTFSLAFTRVACVTQPLRCRSDSGTEGRCGCGARHS